MVRRYKGNLRFLEQLLADPEFKAWLEGQPAKIKERWAKVKKIVHDDALNADIDLFLRVLEPVEKTARGPTRRRTGRTSRKSVRGSRRSVRVPGPPRPLPRAPRKTARGL